MWEKRPTCFKQRKVEVVRDFPKALLENKPCSNVDSSFKSLPPMDKKSAHNICLNKSTVILEYITYAGQLHIEGVSGPLWEHQLSGDRNKKGGKEVKDMPTQIKEKGKQEALFRYVKKRPDIKTVRSRGGKLLRLLMERLINKFNMSILIMKSIKMILKLLLLRTLAMTMNVKMTSWLIKSIGS